MLPDTLESKYIRWRQYGMMLLVSGRSAMSNWPELLFVHSCEELKVHLLNSLSWSKSELIAPSFSNPDYKFLSSLLLSSCINSTTGGQQASKKVNLKAFSCWHCPNQTTEFEEHLPSQKRGRGAHMPWKKGKPKHLTLLWKRTPRLRARQGL